MNTQKIKYTAKGKDYEIEVQGCYPYLENPGRDKVVLVVTANEADAKEADLHALVDNETGIVEYYTREVTVDEEDGTETVGEWSLKEVYENYNAGEIRTSYQSGNYEARVTRLGEYEKRVNQNTADIAFVAAMSDIEL